MAKVCPDPHCPHLQPCPRHSRPSSAHWSANRDRAEQRRFRKATLAAAGYRCQVCGGTEDLQAHHAAHGVGQCLCRSCHRQVDRHAR